MTPEPSRSATIRSAAEGGGAAWRNQIKTLKLLDLEFANDILTGEGETVAKSAPKTWRAEAAADKAEAFRKGRL